MFTAEAAFALFLMLALASAVYWLAERLRFPYTVLLALLGVALAFVSAAPPFAFLREFHLTPSLLFYIFLPTLLFESAYNMNIRRVVDEFNPIMLLAVGAYLISALLIGAGLFFALALAGFAIPFSITLLFGALISATDPVAVLALFKEYGAPRRLTLVFEGESLANDATALALFLVVLGLVEHGVTAGSIALGGITFFAMLIGGGLVGLAMGAVVVKAIEVFRENEMVAITLMIVLAHLSFLVAEIGGNALEAAGMPYLRFSPIIATTVASLFMGNYGRFKVTPRAEEIVDKFWTQFAFMANSIVFILVGFLFVSIPHGARLLWVPVVLTIGVVMVSRALSVYSALVPIDLFATRERRIPAAWQHLLAWGSLRGALAVMLVLLIPPDLTVPGWPLDITPQNFLLVLTVSCIFVTLFMKAPTMGPLMRKLRVDTLSENEEIAEKEAKGIMHSKILAALVRFSEKGYVPAAVAEAMSERHLQNFRAHALFAHKASKGERAAAERMLKLYLIGLEKEVLKDLLAFGEVTERVFKRIYGKLTLQAEAIEDDREPDPHQTHDHRDIFENLASLVRSAFAHPSAEQLAEEQLLYYRAQEILSNKIVKELTLFDSEFADTVFMKEALARILDTYLHYQTEAQEKTTALRTEYPTLATSLDERMAGRSIFRVQERELTKLYQRGLLTPKLYIKLRDEEHAAPAVQ